MSKAYRALVFECPKGHHRHQLSEEVLRSIAFRRPGDGNVWRRADLLLGSKLWLARKSIQDKTAANPAFLLGIIADNLNTAWRDRAARSELLAHLTEKPLLKCLLTMKVAT